MVAALGAMSPLQRAVDGDTANSNANDDDDDDDNNNFDFDDDEDDDDEKKKKNADDAASALDDKQARRQRVCANCIWFFDSCRLMNAMFRVVLWRRLKKPRRKRRKRQR
jgi:hypothetical protein